MRIAVIITGLGIGGAEALLLRVARTIDRAKYNLTFFCLYDDDNRLIPAFQEAGYTVHVAKVFDYTRPLPFRYNVRAILRLARLLRQGGYDVVETHLPHANTVGRLAALMAGRRRLIASEHNTAVKSRWQVRWDCLLAPRTARIRCVSESVKAFVCEQPGIRPDRCTVIYNGIDPAAYASAEDRRAAKERLGIPAGETVIGTVGRLHPQKGYGDLLDAFAQVVQQRPDTRLVLAGDGRERATLEARAAGLGLGDRVRFLGFRQDVPALLRAFDVFVLSSHYEGFGLVIIEAMAAGVPVISTAIPTSQEIIEPEVNGLLTPVQQPAALAETILALLADEALRERLVGRGVRTVAERFSQQTMVRALERLYTEVAGDPASARDT